MSDTCPKAKANGCCNSNGTKVAKSLDISLVSCMNGVTTPLLSLVWNLWNWILCADAKVCLWDDKTLCTFTRWFKKTNVLLWAFTYPSLPRGPALGPPGAPYKVRAPRGIFYKKERCMARKTSGGPLCNKGNQKMSVSLHGLYRVGNTCATIVYSRI